MRSDKEITQEIREETARHRPGWYSWAAMLVSSLTLGALAVLISLQGARASVERERDARLESERAMCAVVKVQDDVYRSTEPVTETGQRMAAALGNLRAAYRCDDQKEGQR